MNFTDPVKADVLADLDALRVKLVAIEPTPEPNPLQAQLDAALAEVSRLQGIVDAGQLAAQATVDALSAA